MSEQLLKATLAELAAAAETTKIKMDKRKHWDGELQQECRRLTSLALTCSRLAEDLKK